MISVFLCILFSYHYAEASQPFDFRLIPFMLGVLYGGYRIGLVVVAIYTIFIIAYPLYQLPGSQWDDTLIYLTPLLFIAINRFRQSGLRMRLVIILSFSLLGLLVYNIIYAVYLRTAPVETAGGALGSPFFVLFSIVFLLTACLVLYMMEGIREKTFLQEGYRIVSRQYREEVEKLNQILNTAPLCVIAIDADTHITAINDMMITAIQLQVPSVTRAQLMGRPLRDLLERMGDEPNKFILLQWALQKGAVEGEVARLGERDYYILAKSIYSQEAGEIVGAVGMAHDVTELSKLRAEIGNMERLHLVGQMAASITHEIRNPMAVIRGFMQLIQEKSPENMKNYYRIVMDEIDRANGIINDFLALAQNRIVEKEMVHLHDIMNQLSPLLSADANLRGQEVIFQLGDNIPELYLDTKEMKQLILNLSRNALESMESMEKRGTLTISTRAVSQGVQLLVSDTGTGIPDSVMEKLFEPFYTTKSKGTGLGLPLCLSIVERHEGTIEIDTSERGTTFLVTFHIDPKRRREPQREQEHHHPQDALNTL
ncbi:signal transduction histidine kinase [Paenibacillus popilliae ATCC 14706]|uniref:histidine kinase n=1 Tax=Paenibacillus popilliae ATCC 14706 TaxID=1212764 RepID=M9L9R4_PAEPP|nr:ATP-binding protein [Paenibacillus popilliae]GAC42212.1 signal transduction histidine kinase [Paenibacillus popilliae ATCC 14706]